MHPPSFSLLYAQVAFAYFMHSPSFSVLYAEVAPTYFISETIFAYYSVSPMFYYLFSSTWKRLQKSFLWRKTLQVDKTTFPMRNITGHTKNCGQQRNSGKQNFMRPNSILREKRGNSDIIMHNLKNLNCEESWYKSLDLIMWLVFIRVYKTFWNKIIILWSCFFLSNILTILFSVFFKNNMLYFVYLFIVFIEIVITIPYIQNCTYLQNMI